MLVLVPSRAKQRVQEISSSCKGKRTVCCPVSGQKKIKSVIFVGIFNSRPPKRTERNTNISGTDCWFWRAFWTKTTEQR